MVAENGKNSAGRRLTSWKEIAAFVGRDERTVKRWEEARGLPVRRVPGTGHASVFAYAHEIEAWLRGSTSPDAAAVRPGSTQTTAPPPHVRRRLARWAALAAMLGLLGVVSAVILRDYRGAQGTLAPARPAVLHKHVPDPVAAEFYRSGLHEWQTRTPTGLARAVADFNRAVARDPRYAEAYVGLADTYNLQREFTAMPPDQAYSRAEAAARRAIALDPSLAGAHAALAFVDFYWWRDVAGARREFNRALALDPGSAVAHHWYATVLMSCESGAALAEIDKAQSLDSESTAILADKGLILFYAGRREEAVKLLTQLEDDEPAFASPHNYLATIELAEGDDAKYLSELRLGASTRGDEQGLALATAGSRGLVLAGHSGMLHAILGAQRGLYESGKQSAFGLAQTYAALNDARDAIACLAISVTRHEAGNITLKIDPAFTAMHNDREFIGLVSKNLRRRQN